MSPPPVAPSANFSYCVLYVFPSFSLYLPATHTQPVGTHDHSPTTFLFPGVDDPARSIASAQTSGFVPGGLAASASSDIIGVPSSETGAISSMANDPSPLAAGDGEQVWQITVRDGGGSPDADALPTILTSLTLSAGRAIRSLTGAR